MQPKNLRFALFLAFTGLFSCNPDNDDNIPIPAMPKIKTITHHQGTKLSSESYEYDSLGRLVKLTNSDGTFTEYENRKDMIIIKTTKETVFPSSDTLLLNDQGLVSSQLLGLITREYVDGMLVKSTYYDSEGIPGSEYDYQTSDGNTIGFKIWDLHPTNPHLLITCEYEFLPQSVNTIGIENRGMGYYGKQDKNLVIQTKRLMHMVHDEVITHCHYQWDSQNRVVKSWTEDNQNSDYYTYIYYN